MSEEAFQTAMKRREVRDEQENERYTHLDVEFQRIARKDKVFLSDQWKEIEENRTMGMTRDFFRKLEIPRHLCMQMGTIKERNGMDLTEAEDIKKRCQEYTEEL